MSKSKKSVGAAIVLTLLFGTLGLFYVERFWSAVGANILALVLTVATGGLAAVVIYPATVIYAAVRASK